MRSGRSLIAAIHCIDVFGWHSIFVFFFKCRSYGDKMKQESIFSISLLLLLENQVFFDEIYFLICFCVCYLRNKFFFLIKFFQVLTLIVYFWFWFLLNNLVCWRRYLKIFQRNFFLFSFSVTVLLLLNLLQEFSAQIP